MFLDLDAAFDGLAKDGAVQQANLRATLLDTYGINLIEDGRLAASQTLLKAAPENLSRQDFIRCLTPCSRLLLKVFNNQLAVTDWPALIEQIKLIYSELVSNKDGDVARYIPQLACVDPEKFGISICTVDGQRFHLGDTREMFSIQSVSKTMNYMLALEEYGPKVHESVGYEPSGRKFNDFVFLPSGLPHNPYINAGAIMSISFVKPFDGVADRYVYMTDKYKELAGYEPIEYSNATYLSEKATGYRNFSLSYAMKDAGAFPEWISDKTKLMDNLDLYFQMCSVEVCTRSLSVMAATMANQGICPTTDKTVIQSDYVTSCLALMYTCGMYNYSGEFAFQVGLPAKSGVSGDLLLVVPGVMGIAIWSPRLDKVGNSVRAVQFCIQLTQRFSIHGYDRLPQAVNNDKSKTVTFTKSATSQFDLIAMTTAMLDAASKGDITTLRRLILTGVDANVRDEDGNTALMVACACGQLQAAKFLVKQGANHQLQNYSQSASAFDLTPEDRGDIRNFLKELPSRPVKA